MLRIDNVTQFNKVMMYVGMLSFKTANNFCHVLQFKVSVTP